MLDESQKFLQFKSDVEWILQSKSFLTDVDFPSQIIPAIEFQDIDSSLPKFDAFLKESYRPAPKRMGRYFEYLIKLILKYAYGNKNVLQGMLVRDGKQVIGEADFVFVRSHLDGTCCLEHWEVASKFYLFVGSSLNQKMNTSLYQGLHLKDKLNLKIKHLKTKQLKILKTKQGMDSLSKNLIKLGLDDQKTEDLSLNSRALMVGRNYFPLRILEGNWLDFLNNKKGIWVAIDEINALDLPGSRFAILANNELLERKFQIDVQFDEFEARIRKTFEDYLRAGVFFIATTGCGLKYQGVVVSDSWLKESL